MVSLSCDRAGIVAVLEKEPLRHVVLLKHLALFPEQTVAYHVLSAAGQGFLVLLETAASPYDRDTYPQAERIVLLSGDGPDATRALLRLVPARSVLVFKLTSDQDRAVVAERFQLEHKVTYHSFTADAPFSREPGVEVTDRPDPAILDLLEAQGHARDWVQSLMAAGRAFACCLRLSGAPVSACFAFQTHGPVWEVGGVFTLQAHRGRGHAARVVRMAHAVLAERGLIARYHVHAENHASLALARRIGLRPFQTLEHHLHDPLALPGA